MPWMHLRCVWLREGSQTRAWLHSQDIWNKPDHGEERQQELPKAGALRVPGSKGDIQGGAGAQGWSGGLTPKKRHTARCPEHCRA